MTTGSFIRGPHHTGNDADSRLDITRYLFWLRHTGRAQGDPTGATPSAIAQADNPFADRHQTWKEAGLHPANARRNVARAIASTLWSLWKTGHAYDPERVIPKCA